VKLQNQIAGSRIGTSSPEDEMAYIAAWLTPANNFPLVRRMLDSPRELEVKVRIYELVGDDLESYHPTSAQRVCLGYEWIRVILADFLKAHENSEIPVTKIQLNRTGYDGEVMIWSAAFDQVFSEQMGQWLHQSYPHARLAIFSDSHERGKDSDYRREFRKAFFLYGLYSPEIQDYFDDPRQLNVAEKV
jgi:hypothetical protein